MRALLLLNGELPNALLSVDLSQYQCYCATDGAYSSDKLFNGQPNLLIGDFDSIAERALSDFEGEIIHAPDQRHTDYHKALAVLQRRGFTDVDVYGATGRSSDHLLGNFSTSLFWKTKLNINLYDDYGRYFFSEKQVELVAVQNCIISLIPFHRVTGITSRGLEYELHSDNLVWGEKLGTRNRAVDDRVYIEYKSGELLIYVSKTQL